MKEIKEKLLETIKKAREDCAGHICDPSCKYFTSENCYAHTIADAITDRFTVLEKLSFGNTDDIKKKLNSIYGKSSVESMSNSITDVIFVEDGSVDKDELRKQFGDGVKIVIYRQGGRIPELKHLEVPITVTCAATDKNESSQKEESNKERELIKKIMAHCDSSFERRPECDEIYCDVKFKFTISKDEMEILNSLTR